MQLLCPTLMEASFPSLLHIYNHIKVALRMGAVAAVHLKKKELNVKAAGEQISP